MITTLLSFPLSELLQFMLGEMQSHLDSNVVRVRGMVVGECLHSCMDLNGAKLKFEDEETKGAALKDDHWLMKKRSRLMTDWADCNRSGCTIPGCFTGPKIRS
ncbi:unnamed protein product [Oncorhynchus mykiss]|uniref:Uncharacterized protein n=1 Tax=Oncorhynchus mykiss TaxID=8022 RepID=A0A060W769_ONCMY|nr:unnamed protein product [Oncorhynchus mykiss]